MQTVKHYTNAFTPYVSPEPVSDLNPYVSNLYTGILCRYARGRSDLLSISYVILVLLLLTYISKKLRNRIQTEYKCKPILKFKRVEGTVSLKIYSHLIFITTYNNDINMVKITKQ